MSSLKNKQKYLLNYYGQSLLKTINNKKMLMKVEMVEAVEHQWQ